MRLRRAAGQLLDVSEAELLEVGEVEAADRFCDVGEGVRSLVAVVGRVRQLARTNRVQHDHAGARHRAILLRDMETVLGLFGMALWIVAVIALAAGMTYAVVRLTPEREDKKPETTEA